MIILLVKRMNIQPGVDSKKGMLSTGAKQKINDETMNY